MTLTLTSVAGVTYSLENSFRQSQPKLVGTLELDHVSPIPTNQCWKISRFFQQKGKKSLDYQHCKWGEGRTCLLSQLFCPGLQLKKINTMSPFRYIFSICFSFTKKLITFYYSCVYFIQIHDKDRTKNIQPFIF